MEVFYKCSYCGTEYINKADALSCENTHKEELQYEENKNEFKENIEKLIRQYYLTYGESPFKNATLLKLTDRGYLFFPSTFY